MVPNDRLQVTQRIIAIEICLSRAPITIPHMMYSFNNKNLKPLLLSHET